MTTLSLQSLAEAACHFGHRVRRWCPRMRPFLWGKKGGIHIFDLNKTLPAAEKLLARIEKISSEGKMILFVSTKPQTKQILAEIQQEKNYPVVSSTWVSGLLTNFDTIKMRLRRLRELREMSSSGEIEKFPKKEQASMRREQEKLEEKFGGLDVMYRLPDEVFVVDAARDAIAVREANRMKIPVSGIADSNVDPRGFTCFVPANDDAISSLGLLLGLVFDRLAPFSQRKPGG